LYEELLNNTSKTLPTHHEKIMIAQEPEDDIDIISNDIDSLIEASHQYDSNLIVQKMKMMVPEYLSMNSHFELLDN
jgi:FlaA1/EpsC-like NDP-sugar epimerase